MIDHTGLDISDPVKSRNFYEQALAPLGYRVLMEVPMEFTGGAVVLGMGVPHKADFWLHQGTPQQPRVHVAFRADDRATVDAFYRAAMAAADLGGLVAECRHLLRTQHLRHDDEAVALVAGAMLGHHGLPSRWRA